MKYTHRETASYSRGGFSLYLAGSTRCVMVPGGSTFHLEPGIIERLLIFWVVDFTFFLAMVCTCDGWERQSNLPCFLQTPLKTVDVLTGYPDTLRGIYNHLVQVRSMWFTTSTRQTLLKTPYQYTVEFSYILAHSRPVILARRAIIMQILGDFMHKLWL